MSNFIKKILTTILGLTLLISISPTNKIEAQNINDKIQSLPYKEGIDFEVSLDAKEHGFVWTIKYDKDIETKSSLYLKAHKEEEILEIITDSTWTNLDTNWYQESASFKSNSEVQVLTPLTTTNIDIYVKDDIDTLEREESDVFEKFELSVSQFITVDNPLHNEELDTSIGENGESIIVVDSMEKLEQVQEEILKLSSRKIEDYEDYFKYTTDDSGTYASHESDKFEGGDDSKTTVNYDYGLDSFYSDGKQTEGAFGSEHNFANGYHTYFQETGEGVLTKQTVKPTSNPERFDIEIDIIGGNDPVSNEIDVILVLDKSSSMNQTLEGKTTSTVSKQRWTFLKAAVTSLTNNLLVDSNNIQIGMSSFGTEKVNNDRYAWTTIANYGSTQNPRYFSSNAIEVVNNKLITESVPEDSGTPTYLGIESGMYLAQQARPEATKFIILLTDGSSTYSPGKDYEDLFVGSRKSEPNGNIKYSFSNSWRKTYFDNSSSNSRHTTKTIEQFENIKNRLANKVNLDKFRYMAMGLGGQDKSTSEQMDKLFEGFAGEHVFDGTTEQGINNAFKEIKDTILQDQATFSDGVLSNKLSEYVTLVPNSINTSALSLNTNNQGESFQDISEIWTRDKSGNINPNAPNYAKRVNVQILNNGVSSEIRLDQMTLGSNNDNRLGYRVEYTVELKEDYIDGVFYRTHGNTVAKSGNHEELLGFASPSVQVPVTDFEFTKVTPDGSILSGAVFELLEGNTVIDKVTSDANGNVIFSELPHGDYIIREVQAPLGYELMEDIPFSINQITIDNEVHDGLLVIEGLDAYLKDGIYFIENKLQDFILEVTKVDNYDRPVQGVKFKLTGENYSQELSGTGVDGNIFTFVGLKPGTYTLSETDHPGQYVTMKDVTIIIDENGDVTIDGDVYGNAITNEGNIIKFKAINALRGILPSTGGTEMFIFTVLPITLLLFALILGTYGNYRQRRYR